MRTRTPEESTVSWKVTAVLLASIVMVFTAMVVSTVYLT